MSKTYHVHLWHQTFSWYITLCTNRYKYVVPFRYQCRGMSHYYDILVIGYVTLWSLIRVIYPIGATIYHTQYDVIYCNPVSVFDESKTWFICTQSDFWPVNLLIRCTAQLFSLSDNPNLNQVHSVEQKMSIFFISSLYGSSISWCKMFDSSRKLFVFNTTQHFCAKLC